jgi:crotonobetainyl-CoA:carnitine CoA-transferase CaiB-like acyl-CoA transferase
VGEHTREVLREIGYTEVEVDELVEGGVAEV